MDQALIVSFILSVMTASTPLLLAATGEGDFYDGKRAAAAYFIAYELPKTGPQLDLLDALDRTTLELDPAWL